MDKRTSCSSRSRTTPPPTSRPPAWTYWTSSREEQASHLLAECLIWSSESMPHKRASVSLKRSSLFLKWFSLIIKWTSRLLPLKLRVSIEPLSLKWSTFVSQMIFFRLFSDPFMTLMFLRWSSYVFQVIFFLSLKCSFIFQVNLLCLFAYSLLSLKCSSFVSQVVVFCLLNDPLLSFKYPVLPLKWSPLVSEVNFLCPQVNPHFFLEVFRIHG